MGDEEATCKVEYLDGPDGSTEETNWIKRAGRAKVTYLNGCTFEGTFDAEKMKQGEGVFVWMGPGEEEESTVEKARYEGRYRDGMRNGFGKMVYPGGDIYEGEWVDGKMQGEGSYTYKKTGDIYSGSWKANKKHGYGRYEFGADKSMLVGAWESGQLVNGSWELKNFANYEGGFKLGRPLGAGKFVFNNGYTQEGTFVEEKSAEDDGGDADAAKPPNVSWRGKAIVQF